MDQPMMAFLMGIVLTDKQSIDKAPSRDDNKSLGEKKEREMQKIFALGSNGSGQLGIGHRDDVSVPTECLFDEDTKTSNENSITASQGIGEGRERKVKRIVCGGNHTIILLEDGAVYAAGLNDDLRCGVCISSRLERRDQEGSEKEDGILRRFRRVKFRRRSTGAVIDRFKDVCATWSATCFIAVTSSSNNTCEKDVVIPLGSGDKGELGLGPGRRSTAPASREVDDSIIDTDDYLIPDFPPPNTYIEAIGSGTNHVVAILSNGDVYGWGASRKGQLGTDSELIKNKIVWSPVKIASAELLKEEFMPRSVSCGREFTFMGGYKKNKPLEGGDDSAGYIYTILGVDDKWNIMSAAPSVQTLQKTSQTQKRYDVSTSWHGIYLHNTLDNSVIAWGRNDRGQLGPHQQQEHSLVRWESVAQFMAGSEHTVAVLSDNRTVVSCGWGEHGNCGSDTDDHGNVKGRLSQIRLPDDALHNNEAKVVRVAAGCATSWIVVSS
ncbi:alpha-tubulin suppressor protein Aats1, putative [Talaromyces stipitatus ATCC 10500]|uniref:Alpha-tubulin suppressor protein Aats1, putative n=1 Tax=Talaromyces stipitatus (strain ATCC 10500 / CBS 375.48 / QM 6759 / NRRL 1006) TaxID=441959 RepID=B8M8R3_TALSN|nr:alpha-tubulin suppressor protein Aats1, putative [Talaromyces stipitatus ATCC 10500]EED20576.1 alpha-tubulin suppressor protein Aats1, putative [Talaromyces stipitatus ATCC 10500]